MGSTSCTLQKKTAQQPDNGNSYNHNFEGRFCECDQVYDVDAEEGTMFQCLVCEDWFHEKCIGEGRVPDQDEFEAFVCRECVGKNEWLGRYVADKTAFLSTLDTYPEITVDIETVEEKPAEQPTDNEPNEPSAPQPATTAGVKRSASADPEPSAPSPKRVKVETESDCKWSALPPTPTTPLALFLKTNFRTALCHCLDCQTLRLRTLPMIAAEEETYEPDQDDSDTDSLLDAGTRALSSLPRTQALDGIVAYQTLSARLKGFFQGFVQTGKVVSEADVKGFFAEMKGSSAVADSASAPAADPRREESAK
jgi:E3 ubiquitin-protein ligase UBR7